jgi:hypothetical protein
MHWLPGFRSRVLLVALLLSLLAHLWLLSGLKPFGSPEPLTVEFPIAVDLHVPAPAPACRARPWRCAAG